MLTPGFEIQRKSPIKTQMRKTTLLHLKSQMNTRILKSYGILLLIFVITLHGCHVPNETEVERKVQVEKHTAYGRMDIYLSNGQNQVVAIENKIYAADQPQQLFRYFTHLQQALPNSSTLLYLTLEGNEATDSSTTGYQQTESGEKKEKVLRVPDHYQTISYRFEIINWIKL